MKVIKKTFPIFAFALVGWINANAQDLKFDKYKTEFEEKLQEFGEVKAISSELESIHSFSVDINKQNASGTKSIVKVDHPNFSEALEIISNEAGKNPWDIGFKSPKSNVEINKGDLIIAVFFIRCLDSDNTGLGKIMTYIEQTPQWASFGVWEGEFDQNWRRVGIIGKVDKELNDNNLWLSMHVADRRQTLQIGGVTLHALANSDNSVDLTALKKVVSTPLQYTGMEENAAWRKEAFGRIEQVRKAEITLELKDEKGKAVKNADIHLQLKKHEFGFGTFLGGIDNIGKPLNDSLSIRYLQLSKNYFNKYTVPMYWANWSLWGWPEKKFEEKYSFGIDWAFRSGNEVRGHVPVWASYKYMPFLKPFKDDPDKVKLAIDEHLEFLFNHPKVEGKFADWDIINEVYANHEILDALPKKELEIVDIFKKSQNLNTSSNLFINDYGILNQDIKHQKEYYDLIKKLLDAGAPIDGIGMQGHLNGAVPPATIISTLDRFAEFDLPIHITELDFYSDFPEDDAKYMRDLLISFFSQPRVNTIIVWGFLKPLKGNWRPEFHFFDENFNETPVAKMWEKMTQEVWSTDTVLQTNKKGETATKSFKGEQTIQYKMNDRTLELAVNLSDSTTHFVLDQSLIDTDLKHELTTNPAEIKFTIPEAGFYQIGTSGLLTNMKFDWYTINLDTSVDGTNLGTTFIDGNTKTAQAGCLKKPVYLEKGAHTIKFAWNRNLDFINQNTNLTISDPYLIQIR